MRRKPQGTEELLVGRNRPLDTLLVGTVGDTPDTLAVLQEFAALLLAQHAQRTVDDNGERRTVRQPVQCGQLMPDHMRRPVLRHSHTDHVVQRQGCRKHILRHHGIIVLVLTDPGCDLDHGMQNAFGPTIHQARLPGRSHILLQHMHVGVGQAVGDLLLRQREQGLGIEDRKERVVAVEREFLLRFMARDHRAVVHFRSRRRHREHRPEGNGFIRLPFQDDLPRVAVIKQPCSDQLRTVDDRPAAHGKQELRAVLTPQCDGLADGLDRRIGLDAPEFDPVTAFEGLDDLVVNAVTAHAATAEGNHNLLAGRNQLCELSDLPFAENQFRRIVINKIIHNSMRYVLIRLLNIRKNNKKNAGIFRRSKTVSDFSSEA